MTSPYAVVSLTARAMDIALTEPFAVATGVQAAACNVLVEIGLADGTVGLGEAAPFTSISGETQGGCLAAIESMRGWLIGQDVRRNHMLAGEMARRLGQHPSARCALEMAIFDAATRRTETPLWALFGGAGTEVETDMTITAGGPEHAAAAAKNIWARGISTLKVKVGALSPVQDLERLEAIHAAAPSARLIADANGGYSPADAQQFLAQVRDAAIPLELFEQPVVPRHWDAFVRALPRRDVLICADESARSLSDVWHLVREGLVDVVNIKPMKTGIVESIAIWHLVTSAGVKLMIGGMVESPLAMSFSAHLAAGLGGFSYVDLDTPMFMKEHPFSGGFEQQGARLSVAHVKAGHGVSLSGKP